MTSNTRVHSMRDSDLGFEAHVAICSDQPFAFGGLRIAPNVTAETVKTLATRMAPKLAGHGVPVGGAKGGIRCTAAEAENPAVIQSFVKFFGPLLRSEVILGKDLGASDGLLDAIYEALGIPQLHLVQTKVYDGCPPRIRQLAGYGSHMTGAGVAWSADAALAIRGIPTKGARILVQGSGRVGLGAAVRLSRLGAVLVGINDRFRGIYNPAGIPTEGVAAAVDKAGTLDIDRCTFEHSVVDRDALLSQEADVVVFAADSNVLTRSLATSIQAGILVEGANAAILDEAEETLFAAGRSIVPDVVGSSSAGALCGSQMGSGNRLDPDLLWQRIEQTIRRGTKVALDAAAEGPQGWRDRVSSRFRELGLEIAQGK